MTVPSKTELRSVTELLGLLNDRLIDLLDRALEIVESAYACPEWVSWNGGRTERTDETLEMLLAAIGPRLKREGTDARAVLRMPAV